MPIACNLVLRQLELMLDQVPTRVWLLIAIAVAASGPARYLYDHITHSPRQRDITQPGEDLTWRSSAQLARSVGLLVILLGVAIFIFTPAAPRLAQSAGFYPMIVTAFGSWSLWTVAQGFRSGAIEPIVKGASWRFERVGQPRRYWMSVGWNTLLGGMCLFLGYVGISDAPQDGLRDRCHDWNDSRTAADIVSACTSLLAMRDRDDSERASLLSARGSGYYKAADYRRAGADYAAAISLAPNKSSFRYNSGLAQQQLGNGQRALEDYDAAIRLDAENADAYVQRGMMFLNRNALDRAIADFTRAHEITPTDVVPLAHRGLAYAWKNDRHRAMQDFGVVRATDPFNIVAYHGEGLLGVNEIAPEQAIPPLSAAIARAGNDAWALGMRAQAYGQLGDEAKARADAEAAQKLIDRASDAPGQ